MDYHTSCGRDGKMTGTELGIILEALAPLGVLVSGGCDSEVLLRASARITGAGGTLALTAETPFMPCGALESAKRLSSSLGVRHVSFGVNLMGNPGIALNTPDRCYLCKKLIYSAARREACRLGVSNLADGTNLDDTAAFRPGLRAAVEEGVIHPLAAAGMTKADVRNLGRTLGMPDPDRPANSCLATRLEENIIITPEVLSVVDRVEAVLRASAEGRIRARVRAGAILLEHQFRDATLVKAKLEELRSLAKASGYHLGTELAE